MIPRTGPIDLDDMNAELGNAPGTELSIGGALTLMGEGTNPDEFNETRGYDGDWEHWLEAYNLVPDIYTEGNLVRCYADVRNNSTKHAYAGTLYWELRCTGVIDSGSVAITSLGIGATRNIFLKQINTTGYSPTISLYCRLDPANSWILVDSMNDFG